MKDAPRADLCQAIRAAANGQSLLASSIASRLLHHVRTPASKSLSARERAVLQLVARGMNNQEAGHELHISESAIKTHLVHIFQKLEVADHTAAVTVAVDQGLIKLRRA